MSVQNIHYELTKQRISQSMKTRGALASFNILWHFLEQCEDAKLSKPSCSVFVWVDDKQAISDAKQLEKALFERYGAQKKRSKSLFLPAGHYEEIFKWHLEPDLIQQELAFIDSLGPLPSLKPRPPLAIVASAKFWLPSTPHEQHLLSSVLAWLSPSSNNICLTLEFPQESIDNTFDSYRDTIQKICPVELENKYFYLRKQKDDRTMFRRAYPGKV